MKQFYLKVIDQYIIDVVTFNPEKEGYILYEAYSLPADILNRCYKLENNHLIIDQEKYRTLLKIMEELNPEEEGDEDV